MHNLFELQKYRGLEQCTILEELLHVEYEKAIEYLHAWFVSPLLVLSRGYGELGNDSKAMEAVQTSLAFARKVQNPALEKTALNLLGDLHRLFGRKQDAIATG